LIQDQELMAAPALLRAAGVLGENYTGLTSAIDDVVDGLRDLAERLRASTTVLPGFLD
jgi:hypothetical protein